MSARDAILKRLRAASPSPVPRPELNRVGVLRADQTASERADRFEKNLTQAMAQVVRTSTAGLSQALAQLIRSHGIARLALGPELLAHTALVDALRPICELMPYTSEHDAQALFAGVDAGLTLTQAGIADTGTLVLSCGPQSPRLLSLVPPIHLAIVAAADLVDTLEPVLQRQLRAAVMPTNLVLVSSPSKTADIQQTLAYGAHGPKQLIVLLVGDA